MTSNKSKPLPPIASSFTPLPLDASCENCYFSVPHPQTDQQVICWRRPPTAYVVSINREPSSQKIISTEQVSVNPILSKGQKCGEWERAQEQEPRSEPEAVETLN
jgi:hypothetical protein